MPFKPTQISNAYFQKATLNRHDLIPPDTVTDILSGYTQKSSNGDVKNDRTLNGYIQRTSLM